MTWQSGLVVVWNTRAAIGYGASRTVLIVDNLCYGRKKIVMKTVDEIIKEIQITHSGNTEGMIDEDESWENYMRRNTMDRRKRCIYCFSDIGPDGLEGFKCKLNHGWCHGVCNEITTTTQKQTYTKAEVISILKTLQSKINQIPINPTNSEPFKLGQASAYEKWESESLATIEEVKEDVKS